MGLLGLVPPFATFFTLIAVYLRPRLTTERVLVGIIVVAGLAVHILSAARLGAFVTLFGLAAVLWLRDGRIKTRHLALFVVSFSLVFAFAAVMLGKGGTRDAGFLDNVRMLADSFRIYLLGGLVAFDKVVRDNIPASPPYYTLRFFYAVAKAMGWNTEVPPILLPFVTVPDFTNVYTIYYPYYTDFGTAGLCLLTGLLGGVLTALYRKARAGRPVPAVLYSLAFAFLLLSSSLEGFAVSLSYWIQAVIFVSVFFRLPGWWSRIRPTG
jgi:oligosaccharide repeat unit polymerase